MKMSTIAFAGFTLLLMTPVWAQETDPAHQIAEQWRMEQAENEARQARLDSLMSQMAEEMQSIRETTDPQKRQSLMATHRENFREAMELMREMGGAHMREVTAGHIGPGPDADGKAMDAQQQMTSVRPRQDMSNSRRLMDLENRLDMMQVMLESMMAEQARN